MFGFLSILFWRRKVDVTTWESSPHPHPKELRRRESSKRCGALPRLECTQQFAAKQESIEEDKWWNMSKVKRLIRSGASEVLFGSGPAQLFESGEKDIVGTRSDEVAARFGRLKRLRGLCE